MIRLVAVLPDPDEARDWAERELERAAYREAEPTLFDRVAQAIGQFFIDLFNPQLGGAAWSPVWTAVIVALIVALIVGAFGTWGPPRGDPRRRRPATAGVYAADERTADELRRAARAAADAGDWDGAIVLRFRAVARALDERGIIHAPPGMTAHAFVTAARDFFPAQAADLAAAGGVFDDVRYLRRPGTQGSSEAIAALDEAVRTSRPAKIAEAAFA